MTLSGEWSVMATQWPERDLVWVCDVRDMREATRVIRPPAYVIRADDGALGTGAIFARDPTTGRVWYVLRKRRET